MSPAGTPSTIQRSLVALAVFTFSSWVLIAAALLTWAPGREAAAGALSRVARAATAVPASAPLAEAMMSDVVAPCGFTTVFNDAGGAGDFSWGLLGDDGDSWTDDGAMNLTQRDGAKGEPRFWFRDRGTPFVVRDRAIIAEVREAARPLRELSRQMGTLGREMGRHGADVGEIGGRLGEVGARMAALEMRAASRESRETARGELRALRAEMASLRDELERERSAHHDEQRSLSRRMSELSARHRDVLRATRAKVRAISERARREGKAERPHANA